MLQLTLQNEVSGYRLVHVEVRPTFLVGAEQSGTTLLRLMLDSHPEVSFAEEFEYAVEPVSDSGFIPSVPAARSHFELSRSFSTSGFQIDESLSFPELVNGFLESRQMQKEATVVGATLHFGFAKALKLWPDSRFIHLVRDPRDVAPARMAEGLAGNVWHGLDCWLRAEDEWAAVEPSIDPQRVLTVRFSDLIRDYDSALTSICSFLGVEYTAQMLDYSADTDYQAPSVNVAGDWRHTLSTDHVRLVEARVGDRLTALGYEPSGFGRASVGERQELLLQWEDRVGRVARRVGVFGVRLTVADMVARGLKIEPLQRSVRIKLNETEIAQRKKSWSETAKYRTSR